MMLMQNWVGGGGVGENKVHYGRCARGLFLGFSADEKSWYLVLRSNLIVLE